MTTSPGRIMSKSKLEKRVDDIEEDVEVLKDSVKWIFVFVVFILAMILILAIASSYRFSKIEAQLALGDNTSWECVEWEETEHGFWLNGSQIICFDDIKARAYDCRCTKEQLVRRSK